MLSLRAGLISPQGVADEVAANASSRSEQPGSHVAFRSRTPLPTQRRFSTSRRRMGRLAPRHRTSMPRAALTMARGGDVTIRRLTSGQKTLDDFARFFTGRKKQAVVWLKPQPTTTRGVRAASSGGAYDWKGSSKKRSKATKRRRSVRRRRRRGEYQLVLPEKTNMFTDPWAASRRPNALASIGHSSRTPMAWWKESWPERQAYAGGFVERE